MVITSDILEEVRRRTGIPETENPLSGREAQIADAKKRRGNPDARDYRKNLN